MEDYEKLIKDVTPHRCHDLRKLLFECSVTMKNGNQWGFYSLPDLYVLIVQMFPSLFFKKIPYYILRNGERSELKFTSSNKELFTFWEFMDPLDQVEDAAQEYAWDLIDEEILVFRNIGLPPIQNFGDPESETLTIYEPVVLHQSAPSDNRRKTTQIIRKGRVFGERILNNRYEMIGAAILQGTTPGKDGGVHYIAYIKTNNGWYLYNDIGNVWEKQKNFPVTVLSEKDGNKPELYIYKRLPDEVQAALNWKVLPLYSKWKKYINL
jgi:hypothetical protein